MINETIPAHDHQHCLHTYKRISWSAIIVGALVGVGLGFLLNLFGIAIGLGAYTVNSNGADVIAIGGLIGLFIGVIVSMTVAGYAAGYLGRHYCPRRNMGIVYGFATWSLALILSALVAGHVSDYAASYARNVLGSNVIISDDNSSAMQSNGAATNANANANANANDNAAANGNSANNTNNASAKANTVNVTPESLAGVAWVLFALFVVGAIFTCIGACWAMCCKRED